MDMDEIVKRVGRDKLKRAIESDNEADFRSLVEEAGLDLSDEQLEAIAGGFFEEDTTSCDCYSF